MAISDYLKVTGIGVALPDKKENGICNTKSRFWEIVKNGETVLSKCPEYQKYDIGVIGKIFDWKKEKFNISKRHISKYSNATLLGIMAVQNALQDGKYEIGDVSNERTLLIVSSSMLTLETLNKQYSRLFTNGKDEVGFDFFIQGTPGSIACGISKVLELDCPIITLTGSCIVASHAIQIACEKLKLGIVDKVIVAGVDDSNDPLYFSSATYRMKTGKTIAALTDDPVKIKPHDVKANGNACGQGAVAVIFEREESKHECSEGTSTFRLHYSNSRKNGHSMFDCGKPDNFGKSVKQLLFNAGITFTEVGFVNDFAEGADFIEDFFIEALTSIRKENNYNGTIYLTNQEAAFGHIGGITGLIKFVSNLMMMSEGIIAPSINCEITPDNLCGTPVIKRFKKKDCKYSMMMNCGAGGDCSIMLIETK